MGSSRWISYHIFHWPTQAVCGSVTLKTPKCTSAHNRHTNTTHTLKGLIRVCCKSSPWWLLESQHALLPGCREDHGRFFIKTTQMIEHKESQHGNVGKAEREREKEAYPRVHVKTHSVEWLELVEKTACARRIRLSLPKLSCRVEGPIVQSATTQFLLDQTEIDCDECACCRAPSAVYSSTEYTVCVCV